MMRPGLLLSILVLLASVAGIYLRQVYRGNTKPSPVASTLAVEQDEQELDEWTPPVPPSSPPPAADSAEAVLLNEAFHLSSLRRLPFQSELAFKKVDEAEIARVWERQLQSQYSSDSLERFGLVLQMLGMVSIDIDLQAAYQKAPPLWEGVVYDGARGQVLYTDACQPSESKASKQQLAQQLMLMLLDQRFAWREGQLLTEVNFDQALAQKAFVQADAAWHMLRYTETDADKSMLWAKAQAMGSHLPSAFAEIELMPFREGVHFCQEITRKNVSLDSMYQQMPTSTAQLLHPERFLTNPPYRPRALKWAQLDLKGAEPTWDNVIGEALTRAWLRQHAANEEADLLAAAIDGDRVILYQVPDDGPQVLWKTVWRNAERANAFVDFIVNRVGAIFGVEESATAQTNGTTQYFPGVLDLEITLRDDEVILLRSTTTEWRKALQDLASRSAFQKRP